MTPLHRRAPAFSAGRSTRSTTGTSPPPRPRAARWRSTGSCSSPRTAPPHRAAQPRASAFHRFAMVVAGGRRRIRASWRPTSSWSAPGPSYTADTLRRLHEAGVRRVAAFLHPGHRRVCRNCDVARLSGRPRPGALRRSREAGPGARADAGSTCRTWWRGCAWWPKAPATTPTEPPCAVFLVNADTPDVSSTEIRERAARGHLARRPRRARRRAPHRPASAVPSVRHSHQEAVLHEYH